MPTFAIVKHRGRTSGTPYETIVTAYRKGDLLAVGPGFAGVGAFLDLDALDPAHLAVEQGKIVVLHAGSPINRGILADAARGRAFGLECLPPFRGHLP